MPSLSGLPPPPLETPVALPFGPATPPWERWFQLLAAIVRGIFESGLALARGDSSANPGDAVLNAPSGLSAIAAGNSTATISNTLVTANTLVFAQVRQLPVDATLTHILRTSVLDGEFIIYGNDNATSDVVVQWFIVGS